MIRRILIAFALCVVGSGAYAQEPKGHGLVVLKGARD